MWMYIVGPIIVIAIVVGVVFTAKRNHAINQNGMEADAVVTRIKKSETTDTDTLNTTIHYTYYVTYQTQGGQTVEAKLASGKSFENRIGKSWDSDLHEGSNVRIKYLPEKPKYVIRMQ